MAAAERETEVIEEMKEETKTTVQTVEDVLEKATPEVRAALEAMRRLNRVRKALTQPAKLPQTKYFRLS